MPKLPPSSSEIMRTIGRSPPGRHFGIPRGRPSLDEFNSVENIRARIWTKDGKHHTVGPFDDLEQAEATIESMIQTVAGTDDEIVDWTVERAAWGDTPDIYTGDL